MSASSVLPSVHILDSHIGSIKGIPFEVRSGDDTAVVVASTLASLSDHRKEFSLVPLSSEKDEDAQQGSEMPCGPENCEVSDNCGVDVEMKDIPDNSGPSWGNKARFQPSNAPNEDLAHGRVDVDSVDLSRSTAPELGLNFANILDNQRVNRDLIKDLDHPILTETRRQAYKDALQQGLLDANKIEVSFGSFPYYLRYVIMFMSAK